MPDKLPTIPEILSALQRELGESQRKRETEGREAMFSLTSVDVELSVIAKATHTAKGGINISLFALTGERAQESHAAHKVTLHLSVPSHVRFGQLPSAEE